MGAWESPNIKAIVCTPRKFCWHLITKREEWKKKISQSPQQSLRVILRERNLCDIDRIVHNWRCFAHAHQTTQLHQLSLSGLLWSASCRALKQQRWWMSGHPVSLFPATCPDEPFTDSTLAVWGKKSPQIKPSPLSLLLFSQLLLINT